jgi:hypothetical protein
MKEVFEGIPTRNRNKILAYIKNNVMEIKGVENVSQTIGKLMYNLEIYETSIAHKPDCKKSLEAKKKVLTTLKESLEVLSDNIEILPKEAGVDIQEEIRYLLQSFSQSILNRAYYHFGGTRLNFLTIFSTFVTSITTISFGACAYLFFFGTEEGGMIMVGGRLVAKELLKKCCIVLGIASAIGGVITVGYDCILSKKNRKSKEKLLEQGFDMSIK